MHSLTQSPRHLSIAHSQPQLRIPVDAGEAQDAVIAAVVGSVCGSFNFLRENGRREEAERFANLCLARLLKGLAEVRAA